MGSYHLIGVLLLLFVARSQENIIYDEDTTTPIETDPLPSTGSPLVRKQEVEASAPPKDTFVPVPLPSTGSPLVLKQEVETLAPPKDTSVPVPLPSTGSPSVRQQEVETSPKVPSVSVATEVFTSQEEPTTVSNAIASTTIIPEDFKVTNESSTPATAFNDPSSTLKRVDRATTTAKDEDDGLDNLTDDQGTTSPSTTQNETRSREDDVTQMDTKKGKEEDSPTTIHPGQETNKDKLDQNKNKKWIQVILIGVGIVVLILVLATMVFFLFRKKKRSGSFRTQSKKNAKRDVWAGQVPELGEGRAAQDLAMAENGRAGTELETVKEEEMITFVSGEKKTDSAIEMNELGAGEKATANGGVNLGQGDTAEEKTPLLEEASEESPKPDEQFPVPPMEQELIANGVQ